MLDDGIHGFCQGFRVRQQQISIITPDHHAAQLLGFYVLAFFLNRGDAVKVVLLAVDGAEVRAGGDVGVELDDVGIAFLGVPVAVGARLVGVERQPTTILQSGMFFLRMVWMSMSMSG